jgi:undecaprenyl-diphosphatase
VDNFVCYRISMSIWQAIIVGFVQGLTEFLPVSSDGHLVLVDALLQLPMQGRDALGFDILLHAGSLLAILIVYRATWADLLLRFFRMEKTALRMIGLLLVATVPGVIAGLSFDDTVSNLRSYTAAGLGFLATGLILIIGEEVGRRRALRNEDLASLGVSQALLIGIAQAVAILPGVSRSGSTISVGRALGLGRPQALDFSFLMAAPIIAGAVGKTLVDAWQGQIIFPAMPISLTGFVVSFIVSMFAIILLKMLVVRRSLAVFSWYVIPLGIALLLADRL